MTLSVFGNAAVGFRRAMSRIGSAHFRERCTMSGLRKFVSLGLLLAVAACSPDQLVTPSFRYGPPAGGGGNGGGGGGKKGDIYADLVLLYRAVDGRPIMKEFGTDACLQPVSYDAIPGITPVTNPANGKDVWLIPLVGDGVVPAAEEVEVCDVDPAFLTYVREVELGRLNLGRSPTKVLDRAFAEVLRNLEAASVVLLDPAGRLEPDGVAIDAPAENYAIHTQLQIFGGLSGPLGTYPLPIQPGAQHPFLDHAASGLAGAADKTGTIGVDRVAYSNRIMGIADATSVLGVLVSQRVGGVLLGVAGEKYVSYGGYTYSRSATFPGCASGFLLVGTTTVPFSGTLIDLVFGGQNFTGSNINGFAQRADDALKVIAFAHDNVITSIDRIGTSTTCP